MTVETAVGDGETADVDGVSVTLKETVPLGVAVSFEEYPKFHGVARGTQVPIYKEP